MTEIITNQYSQKEYRYFYGCVCDWEYLIEPSSDWVEGYSSHAFLAYRKNAFTGEVQILSDGESQSETEQIVYDIQRLPCPAF